MSARYAALEAGGTKFVCAVGDASGKILAEARIATTTPAQTLGAVVDFFASHQHGGYSGMGIAAFGPLDLHPASPTFGRIRASPKAQWSQVDLVAPFATRFACPVAIDTDVNAAALAEAALGAGRECNTVVYITVGTGIGGGAVIGGRTLRGAQHPEMGHIRVARHPFDRDFPGVCPFHGDCLEGLASGPALHARYGVAPELLPPGHAAFTIVSHYLAQLAVNVILLLAPQRVIFGGGVMERAGLLDAVRAATGQLLNGYAGLGASADALTPLIVAPGLGTRAGITGALRLALGAR